MWFSLHGAVIWGTETHYAAQQLGMAAKACYLPLTLCLGETVNPLNFPVVLPAFIGFGIATISGVAAVFTRRRTLAVLLLIQVAIVFLSSLAFAAIGAKHLTILLPALWGLIAIGLLSLRAKWLGWLCGALILATMCASLFNYFTNRQFADADMVTPWREIAAAVERSEKPGDALIIGYQPDRGVFDIFRRYYRGKLEPQYLDFPNWQGHLTRELKEHHRAWILLHDTDPWQKMEDLSNFGRASHIVFLQTFQIREHTQALVKAGFIFGAPDDMLGMFQSPLYRLYLLEGSALNF
jgi:hypothetical protein